MSPPSFWAEYSTLIAAKDDSELSRETGLPLAALTQSKVFQKLTHRFWVLRDPEPGRQTLQRTVHLAVSLPTRTIEFSVSVNIIIVSRFTFTHRRREFVRNFIGAAVVPCKRHVLTKGLTDEEEQLLENLSMVLVIRAVEDTTLRGLVKSRTEAMNAAPEGKIGHFTLTGDTVYDLEVLVVEWSKSKRRPRATPSKPRFPIRAKLEAERGDKTVGLSDSVLRRNGSQIMKADQEFWRRVESEVQKTGKLPPAFRHVCQTAHHCGLLVAGLLDGVPGPRTQRLLMELKVVRMDEYEEDQYQRRLGRSKLGPRKSKSSRKKKKGMEPVPSKKLKRKRLSSSGRSSAAAEITKDDSDMEEEEDEDLDPAEDEKQDSEEGEGHGSVQSPGDSGPRDPRTPSSRSSRRRHDFVESLEPPRKKHKAEAGAGPEERKKVAQEGDSGLGGFPSTIPADASAAAPHDGSGSHRFSGSSIATVASVLAAVVGKKPDSNWSHRPSVPQPQLGEELEFSTPLRVSSADVRDWEQSRYNPRYLIPTLSPFASGRCTPNLPEFGDSEHEEEEEELMEQGKEESLVQDDTKWLLGGGLPPVSCEPVDADCSAPPPHYAPPRDHGESNSTDVWEPHFHEDLLARSSSGTLGTVTWRQRSFCWV